MEISDVPEELHMFILSCLDGRSLINAKRSCKMWASLVENLEKYFHVWLVCCLNEIPLFILTEIMGYRQVTVDQKSLKMEFKQISWKFWREIYAEYQRAITIDGSKAKMIDIFYKQSHSMVTSLVIHDGRLLTGHEDGSVFYWKNMSIEGIAPKLIHKHERRVTSMEVTSTCLDVKDLLTVKCRTLVVTGSQDYGVFVSDLKKQKSYVVDYYNKQVNCVSCFGPYITSAGNSSFVQGQTVWHMSTGDNDIAVKQESKLDTPVSNLTQVALTEDKVIISDDNGSLYKWTWRDGIPNKCVKIKQLSTAISSMILKDDYIVCLLDNGDLVMTDVKGNYYKEWKVYQTIQKQTESIDWRGPIFALGTKGGVIFLYVIKDIDDMKNLNLSQPASKLTVDAEHINHIAIGDDGACPLIAIATEHLNISLFRFTK